MIWNVQTPELCLAEHSHSYVNQCLKTQAFLKLTAIKGHEQGQGLLKIAIGSAIDLEPSAQRHQVHARGGQVRLESTKSCAEKALQLSRAQQRLTPKKPVL
jgi:hypothetical protein